MELFEREESQYWNVAHSLVTGDIRFLSGTYYPGANQLPVNNRFSHRWRRNDSQNGQNGNRTKDYQISSKIKNGLNILPKRGFQLIFKIQIIKLLKSCNMEKTEKALVTFLETGNKIIGALADDGKIDFGEGMGIAMKGVGIVAVFKSLPEIKEELKTVTPEKVNNLVEVFKAKFDLPNDQAEQKVEQGIEVLAHLAVLILKKEAG